MQLSHCSRIDCTSSNVHHLEKYFKSNNVGQISYTFFILLLVYILFTNCTQFVIVGRVAQSV